MSLIVSGLVFALTPVLAAGPSADTVPVSKKIIKGVLPNGLTYYVMHNESPKERADFYIIRKVGAIVEEDHENGLAHFLEHMAFNGTKNFPEKGIINMLERHGVDFGRSINAYTGQNQTVYTLFNIPTTDSKLIDSSLLVLHDWSHYLSLTEKEINAERGVILEEWRTGEDSGKRIRKIIYPYLFNHSKYSIRDVIGDTSVILNFKPQTIRDFYHRWYRPDLEAIAIVGDVDAAEIERKIKAGFSSVPMPENPVPFPDVKIRDHKEPYFVVARDKEETNTAIQVYRRFNATPAEGKRYLAYLREGMVESLLSHVIRTRITSVSQQPASPFINAGIGANSLVPGYDSYMQYGLSRAGVDEQLKTVRGLYTLNEQMLRYGFDASELEMAKADFKANITSRYNEREKRSNNRYIEDIIDNFLEGEPLVEYEDYYRYALAELEKIGTEDLHALLKRWDSSGNMVVIVTAPQDSEVLSREQFFALYDSIRGAEDIPPFYVKRTEGELIDGELAGSAVVREKKLKDIDASIWKLKNGATVVYKHADYDKDRVDLYAVSTGGYDRYGLDLLPSAAYLDSFLPYFGLGKFSMEDLKRKMAGVKAGTTVAVSSGTDLITGRAVPKDFEKLMQLTYLRFEQPRFDSVAYEIMKEKFGEMLAMKGNDPVAVIGDSLSRILTGYSPREILMNKESLSAISLEKMEKIYRERFCNARDYLFVIVGNVPEDTVRAMTAKYLGSIASDGKKDRRTREEFLLPEGKTEKVVPIDMESSKAYVFNVYSSRYRNSLKNTLLNRMFSRLMSSRYFESMREKEGGTYGVRVGERNDEGRYGLIMSFECAPDRSGVLNSMIRSGLDSIAEAGPHQAELDKIVENMLKEKEQAKESNAHVLRRVLVYLGEKYDVDDSRYFEDIVKSITVKDIRNHAVHMLKKPDLVNVRFVPEGFKDPKE